MRKIKLNDMYSFCHTLDLLPYSSQGLAQSEMHQ